MASMEDSLFLCTLSTANHGRAEGLRLCYVGMTKPAPPHRHVVTTDGASAAENKTQYQIAFLGELPELVMQMGVEGDRDVPQVDLTAERWGVREARAKTSTPEKPTTPSRTSGRFFRGVASPPVADAAEPTCTAPAVPSSLPVPSAPQGTLFGTAAIPPVARPPQLIPPIQARRELPKVPPAPKRPAQTGTVVEHPKYGTGTIVRREGEGDDAKVVVIFQRYGMKKLVEKYAGLTKS